MKELTSLRWCIIGLHLFLTPACLFAPEQAKAVDSTFVEHYCTQTVAQQWAPAERHALLQAAITEFKAARRSQDELDRLLTVSLLYRQHPCHCQVLGRAVPHTSDTGLGIAVQYCSAVVACA
jgi:hypothetical protein